MTPASTRCRVVGLDQPAFIRAPIVVRQAGADEVGQIPRGQADRDRLPVDHGDLRTVAVEQQVVGAEVAVQGARKRRRAWSASEPPSMPTCAVPPGPMWRDGLRSRRVVSSAISASVCIPAANSGLARGMVTPSNSSQAGSHHRGPCRPASARCQRGFRRRAPTDLVGLLGWRAIAHHHHEVLRILRYIEVDTLRNRHIERFAARV